MTKGPGSAEGWGEARKHMTHPAGLIALRTWIGDRRRTRAHAEQLCKRWGVEMPTREELVERRDA